jgi:hypothetical protein
MTIRTKVLGPNAAAVSSLFALSMVTGTYPQCRVPRISN